MFRWTFVLQLYVFLSALLSHPAFPDLGDVHGMIIFFRIPSFIFFRFIEVFRFDLVMVKLSAYQHLCSLFESRLTVYFCQMQTGLFDLVRDIFAGDFARYPSSFMCSPPKKLMVNVSPASTNSLV